ncbi:MAG TPA: hypothetical protein VMD30_14395, partial [Tepidisphaeraceae bacterium]|nr:hypothetical protein [Tepidisphaeraceae bacterium]
MRTTLLHLVLIVLSVWAVYGQSVVGQFVDWDDGALIRLNDHIASGKIDGLIWHWENAHDRLYIPAVYTVWWCISATVGLKPWAFHTANLVVFSAAACIGYSILRMLVGQPWPALAGALLLALHPLQVEPVAWVTGMKDVLCLFFCLGAIALYLRRGWYWLATICFALAMLCKPSAVVVPVILVAIDQIVLRSSWRSTLWRAGPWLAGALVMGLVAAHVQPPNRDFGGPLWSRPLIAADS